MTERKNNWWPWLRIVLVLIVLAFFILGIDWTAVWGVLRTAKLGFVVAAFVIYFFLQLLKYWRWQWLLNEAGVETPLIPTMRSYFTGAVVNIFGLGRFGEVARIVALNREIGAAAATTAGTIFVEKLFDLVFLGITGVAVLFVLADLGAGLDFDPLLFQILPVVGVFAVLVTMRFGAQWLRWFATIVDRFEFRWKARVLAEIEKLAVGVASLSSWRQLLTMIAITSLMWVLIAISEVVLLPAFDIQPTIYLGIAILFTGYVSTATKMTPANIGVFHVAVVAALAPFGIAREPALAYAILFHLLISGVPLVQFTILYLLRSGSRATRLELE